MLQNCIISIIFQTNTQRFFGDNLFFADKLAEVSRARRNQEREDDFKKDLETVG